MKSFLQTRGRGKTLLLFLLLSVAGIGKTFAQDFYALVDGSVWGFNYVDTDLHTVEVAQGVNASIVSIPSVITYSNQNYTVVGIGASAFYYGSTQSQHTSISIPNTVTYIGDGAFRGCRKLTSIEIPGTVTTIGDDAFFNCLKLASVTLTAPSALTSIGAGAFKYCRLSSIDIPSTVTTIGEGAFASCPLTTITLPNSVTSIEKQTFSSCSSLASIELPNALISIGQEAFYGCSLLALPDLPNTLTTIGDGAFWGCNGITSFTLPASVISVGEGILRYCTALADITVAAGNTVYDSRNNCHAIIETATNILVQGCKNTIFPTTVTAIGSYSFANCSGLESINIPNTVTSIGNYAFYGCGDLTSIGLPNSVTTLEEGVFWGCGFGSFVIPDWVTSIGTAAFRNCGNLLSVSMGNSVETIGRGAFDECYNLETVNFTNSVTRIGEEAFFGCSSLESVTIPISVTSIGGMAFLYCWNLATVNLLSMTVPTLELDEYGNNNAFYCLADNVVFYVPYESLEAYQTATNWSDLASQMQPMAYKSIAGYGTGNGNWAFIASPLTDANLAPTTVENMIPSNGNYDLYLFDQSEANEWQNYKAHTQNFVLENGQGYLYANAENTNVFFKGTFNEDNAKTIDLVYDEGKDFAGINLVGNPFPVNAYSSRPYYVMNPDGDAVTATPVSVNEPIAPCTGVIVKVEASEIGPNVTPTVTFSTTAPSNSNKGNINIALSQQVNRGSTTIDNAIVSFNEGDQLGKYVFKADNAKVYIPQNGKNYAIAVASRESEMPINFKAVQNGVYTLTITPKNTEISYLHLIDNLTGTDVDLIQNPSYTFNAQSIDYASRFRLLFSFNGINENTDDDDFAFFNGREWVINDNENATVQIVDLTGRILASYKNGVNAVSTKGMASGMYMLQLIEGNNVKTQKIVLK